MTIIERVENFKIDIKQEKLNSEEIFQKHLIDGPTFFFHEFLNEPSTELIIKSIISKTFSVSVHEVLIVGSGKLGFSLKPKALFNEFDFLYSSTRLNKNKSDLDIAIVSTELYESIGKSLYGYTSGYKNKWYLNEYYPAAKAKQFQVPICYKYFEYFTKGWFRPDFKPKGFDFCITGSYEDLKGMLYRKIDRKVRLAIYQNWFYFMDYHISNINNLKLKLKTSVL
jgi:hypothetical protein